MYGDYTTGIKQSDLYILNTLTVNHKLAELRTCLDENGVLVSIQSTVGLFTENGVIDKIDLTEFGVKPEVCSGHNFKEGEAIERFTFYYTSE